LITTLFILIKGSDMMHEIELFSLTNQIDLKQLRKMVIAINNNKMTLSPLLKSYPYHKKIWYENQNRHFLFKLQSLTMINHLLSQYKLDKDDHNIERALQLFYQWYEENFKYSRCDLCFHPRVIAHRLITASDLLCICKTLNLCILDDLFIEVMATHTKLLADCDYYKKDHFDGIDQDIVLLVSSIVYNHYYIDNAFNAYIDIASKRLMIQLDYFIDEHESSFLAQSLQSAYRLFLRLNDFVKFLDKYTDSVTLAKQIIVKLDALYRYLFAFTQPGGFLPPIGDGTDIKLNQNVFLSYPHPYSKYYKYLFSYGKKGTQLVDKHHYFLNANQLVVNDVKLSSMYYQLIFYNSFYTNYRKHHDNLAFSLYYKGYSLFIDGGLHQANNCYAHNTICVDFLDYQIDKSQINHSGIVNVVLQENMAYACGVHTLYDDVIIKRNLLFVSNQLFLIDEIFAKKIHDYDIIFNLNPILKLQTNNRNQYYGLLNHEIACTLKTIFTTTELKTQYFYGKHKNESLSTRQNKQPTHRLIYQGKGKNELIITQISLGDRITPIEVIANDKSIQLKVKKDTYTIIRGKIVNELTQNGIVLPQKLSKQSLMSKAIKSFYGPN